MSEDEEEYYDAVEIITHHGNSHSHNSGICGDKRSPSPGPVKGFGEDNNRWNRLFDMSMLLQHYCREHTLPIFNHSKTIQIILERFM